MRNVIFALSILFFLLSALITIKALGISVSEPTYSGHAEAPLLPTPVRKQLPDEQDANRALVADLQAKIASLENRLTTKEETIESLKAENNDSESRTVTVFGGGTFRSGQDVINDISFDTIENLVSEISSSPESRVIIEGHTDNIPINQAVIRRYRDNMDLSFQRAKAIANILTFHGISADRISVIGYGDTRPIASNDTEEGRARNRRVEVKLVPGGKF